MADTSSTTTFRADISSLRAEMQAASRAVRVANSEFKAATSGMDDWSSSADGLEAKIKQLKTTLDAQNKQVALAAEELEKTAEEYGENSAEADRARIKYNNFKAAAASTEKALNQYEDQLDDVEDETEDVEEATKDASDGFTIMKGALADLAASAVKMGLRALTDFGKETFKVGSDFQKAMSQVEAVSGASAEEMQLLSDKAKEMGSTTIFSASESAEAFNYMAMAGWKTEDMLDGIEGIMNLAAASGADLATTSDIVTDALTAMGYEAKDAGHLADVMAAAASNSNTNVEMMGATFQYAAPLVGALGYNMEDTAVAIGMMANAGIKGEKAGTALRSILTRMSTGTGECADAMAELGISMTTVNEDGTTSMRSLDDVMTDLRTAFADLDESQQAQFASSIAGQEAMSGLLAIVNGSDEDFNNLKRAINNSDGAAKSMADTMNDNVDGALTLLKSNIEGKMIGVFEAAAPQIQTALEQISEALDNVDWDAVGEAVGNIAEKIGEFITWVLENGDTVSGILEGVGGALLTVFAVNKASDFIKKLGEVSKAITNIGTDSGNAEKDVSLLSKLITSPEAWAIGLIAAVTIAVQEQDQAYKDALRAQHDFTEEQQKVVDRAGEVAESYGQLKESREKAYRDTDSEFQYLSDLVEEYNGLIDKNGEVKGGYEERAEFIIGALAEAMGVERDDIQQNIEQNGKFSDSIYDVIKAKEAEAMIHAGEDAYTEAIKGRTEAFQAYQDALGVQAQKEAELTQATEDLAREEAALDEIRNTYPEGIQAQEEAVENAKVSMQAAQDVYDEASEAVEGAKEAYEGFNSTIENHEGLVSAVMTGDADAIADALSNIKYDFKTAESATKETLEAQVETYRQTYKDMKTAVEQGAPGITQAMVDEAAGMVEKAEAELAKLETTASEAVDNMVVSIEGKEADVQVAGESIGQAFATGNDLVLTGSVKKSGEKAGQTYADGAASKKGEAKKSGQTLGSATVSGLGLELVGMNTSGQAAGAQFSGGVSSKAGAANSAGRTLGTNAKSGASSVDVTSSGSNFAQGFINGIGSLFSAVFEKARQLAQKAWAGLKQGQAEGSPSKLTYQSGVYFTQGYINGIASQQKTLVSTVKGMVATVIKELAKMSNYNFEVVGENASSAFGDAITRKTNYIISRIQYQNENKLAEFDAEIERLQAERQAKTDKLQEESDKKIEALEKKKEAAKKKESKAEYDKQIKAEREAVKKRIKASEAEYDKLIKTQEKYQDAYSKASSEMLAEFEDAIATYQASAQKLIDDTINGITDRYNKRYDDLLGKQDNLINKLKKAGELFDISGAGVMTINDITEQTRQIKDYTAKLQKIRGKVSDELFEEITSFDMKEGAAYLERLLAMSASDLNAYNRAYTEKMQAAQAAGEKIYKSDFDKIAADYKAEINKAFKDLPKQLEDLGVQVMKGFVTGLTSNTDYMSAEIRTFINGMVDTFKKELKISSPSKVMFGIGEYTGEGYVNGLLGMIRDAKSAATQFANSVSSPLEGLSDIGGIIGRTGTTAGRVINNYNLVQNNTSPKALTALETYQARRRQIALVKAFS